MSSVDQQHPPSISDTHYKSIRRKHSVNIWELGGEENVSMQGLLRFRGGGELSELGLTYYILNIQIHVNMNTE